MGVFGFQILFITAIFSSFEMMLVYRQPWLRRQAQKSFIVGFVISAGISMIAMTVSPATGGLFLVVSLLSTMVSLVIYQWLDWFDRNPGTKDEAIRLVKGTVAAIQAIITFLIWLPSRIVKFSQACYDTIVALGDVLRVVYNTLTWPIRAIVAINRWITTRRAHA